MSLTPRPIISVVMPVYNGGSYLIDAVASILSQTHRDWELICVNDGSTDASGEMLDWFATHEVRMRVVHQSNAGIVGALNHGCSLARGPLICRMDQDDIALPQRLAWQLEHMRGAPECVVVGGAILEIDGDGDPLAINRLPVAHAELVERLLSRRTGHFHPTTLFRAEAFEAVGGYRPEYQWVEDHDLWLRLSQRGQLANLSQVVLCYRMHASSICWQHSAQQRGLMNQLLAAAYRSRGRDLPDDMRLDEHRHRTAAGPGKWARVAAKGGFPSSLLKHLTQLWHSPQSTGYKTRMSLECALKLPLGYARRCFSSKHRTVPEFADWHQRWRSTQGSPRANAA